MFKLTTTDGSTDFALDQSDIIRAYRNKVEGSLGTGRASYKVTKFA